MSRLLLYCMFPLVALGCLVSCGKGESTEEEIPVITFTRGRLSYDFGVLRTDTLESLTFSFKNGLDYPLTFDAMTTGCRCSVVQSLSEPLQPGAVGEVTLENHLDYRPGPVVLETVATFTRPDGGEGELVFVAHYELADYLQVSNEVIPLPTQSSAEVLPFEVRIAQGHLYEGAEVPRLSVTGVPEQIVTLDPIRTDSGTFVIRGRVDVNKHWGVLRFAVNLTLPDQDVAQRVWRQRFTSRIQGGARTNVASLMLSPEIGPDYVSTVRVLDDDPNDDREKWTIRSARFIGEGDLSIDIDETSESVSIVRTTLDPLAGTIQLKLETGECVDLPVVGL